MLDSFTPCPKDFKACRTTYDPDIGIHWGSMLYIRKDIPHVPIPLQSRLQAVAIQAGLNRRYTVCSLYLPPSTNITKDSLLNLIQQLPQPFVIMDLSICSSNCALDFEWKVLDDLRSSDHYPTVLYTQEGAPTDGIPRWCTEKADWTKFEELSTVQNSIDSFSSVEAALEYLNDTLYTAGINSIPKSSGKFRRRPVPWWSDTIRNLHRATRRALTRLHCHRNDENLVAYRKSRALLRRTIKEAKHQSWAKFVSSFNYRTPASTVWKKLRKISGKYTISPPPVLKLDGSLVFDPKDVSNALANHFANISKPDNSSSGYQYRMREQQRNLDFTAPHEESYNLPFTEKEYDSALNSCRCGLNIRFPVFGKWQHHISVFFGLEKAYDTTWKHGILKAVHAIGIRGEMAFFIKNFLANRVFRIRVGNIISEIRQQEEGVPQGGVLSVILFSLAINGVTSVIPPDILATLFDDQISCVDETRFLELIFDKHLSWVPYLKTLKTRCLETMQILSFSTYLMGR
ncbi:uncharacterized protein LOC143035597 [Oratosquilla oratoria]|uniref:uncharacterized protein LOC143035597 n=1 Tax=Oratosquilla oratoria TaxID=337810 RepID=UPI003F77532E